MQTFLFLAFIIIFSVLNLALPEKEFSQQENRYLAKAPDLTLRSFFFGSFTADFEKYITDHFPFRDNWIAMKSASERLSGKSENNNVFFCSDDVLISRFSKPDHELIRANINAVNSLAESIDIPLYFSLIPGAVKIWEEKLPANATNYDQKLLIDSIYSEIDAVNADVLSALYEHRDEYIFFRTDHHWTPLGAYYGYTAHCLAMGLTPLPFDGFIPNTVSDDFYGTIYSSSGVRWIPPDRIDLYVPDKTDINVIAYESGREVQGLLYDYSYLEKKDKYSMFLGGNTPLLKIVTNNANAPKLLILRDSFTDSEVPYLLSHFSEIHLIDLRYYLFSVKEYIADNSIDSVLVNYGVSSFVTDNYIFKAAY